MRTKLYKPSENVYPETLVVAPYTFGGVPANSDARLQETAIRANVAILGIQSVGTGNRAIFDMYRGATRPGRFRISCARDVDALTPYIEDYAQIIGWGDSGRGINIMRMHYDTAVFDRLLIRDGINLGFKDSKRNQIQRFLQYSEAGLPRPATDLPPKQKQGWLSKLITPVETLAEMYNYSDILSSNESLELARRLAAWRGLPMRIVGVSHSFTGSCEDAHRMTRSLTSIRNLAFMQSGLYSQVHADVIEGGHSELLRPGLAALHIGQTMAIDTVAISLE